jgi:ribosomal protein L21E
MDLRLNTAVQIDAPKSAYHGMTGKISKRPLLDHKGRPASVQVDINGELIWFAISAISQEEQAA